MANIKVNDHQLDARLSQLEQARSWSPRVISKLKHSFALRQIWICSVSIRYSMRWNAA